MSTASPTVYELNGYGERPADAAALEGLGRELAAQKKDAFLYEAFVLDTRDPAVVDYSNGRIFILQRPEFSGSVCLEERRARIQAIQRHRVGFYRYSAQQSPPVDAFFLQDIAPDGEQQFEVLDYLHNRQLPYVKPDDLRPAELAYLDRVAEALKTLNDDLDTEQRTAAPPVALVTMRRDFERVTVDLAANVPQRLVAYRDSRLKRFLQNYDLILVAEESAALGQGAQQIHSAAFEQHRRFYFQEPRITRLIGYLYLQEPGQPFSDDDLSTVNWAVF